LHKKVKVRYDLSFLRKGRRLPEGGGNIWKAFVNNLCIISADFFPDPGREGGKFRLFANGNFFILNSLYYKELYYFYLTGIKVN
jgi:hypothetical protein